MIVTLDHIVRARLEHTTSHPVSTGTPQLPCVPRPLDDILCTRSMSLPKAMFSVRQECLTAPCASPLHNQQSTNDRQPHTVAEARTRSAQQPREFVHEAALHDPRRVELVLYVPYKLSQDPGEFSDGDSEDSGFEESVDANDRKKEKRLENNKYDMALEVNGRI